MLADLAAIVHRTLTGIPSREDPGERPDGIRISCVRTLKGSGNTPLTGRLRFALTSRRATIRVIALKGHLPAIRTD